VAALTKLLNDGSLVAGDVIVWKRPKVGSIFEATVLPNGKIETSDGLTHNSPSSAARHLNGGVAINGWRVWKVIRLKKSLLDLRAEKNHHVYKRRLASKLIPEKGNKP
jgi:hypothetical protein